MTETMAAPRGTLDGEPGAFSQPVGPAPPISGLVRFAWTPIAVHIGLAAAFYSYGAQEVTGSKELGAALNVVFVMGAGFFVALLAARSHVTQPTLSILFMGMGGLTLAYAGLLAGMSLMLLDSSAIATMYRVTALMAAACHLIGAFADVRAPHKRLSSVWTSLLGAYLSVTLAVVVLVVLIRWNMTPVFFIPGSGPTLVCQVVTTLGGIMFVAAALILCQASGEYVVFRRWYGYGLALFAVSLVVGSLQLRFGDPLSWVNRSAKAFGGAYLVIAAIVFIRQNGAWTLPLELALRRTEEQLRAAHERLAMALSAGRAGFFDWDLKRGTVFRSPELDALLGGSPGASEKDGGWSDAVVAEDLARAEAVRRMCMERHREDVDFELRAAPPGAGVRWLACQGRIRYDADREPERMIGVAIDVTDRKAAEEEVVELNRGLEARVNERTAAITQVNAELESFAASVSRDLRAPLRGVDGFSRILHEGYRDRLDEEGRRCLDLVRTSTVRMARLIDDLLHFSSLASHELKKEPVDMAALAREVFDTLRRGERGRDIRLTIGELPEAHCDRALMRQALDHLLGNAIRFTAPREIAEIELWGAASPEECVYRVRDNGVGFDMKYAHKLFGVFQRLHSMDEFEGTGIGLAIVKRVMDLHGGRVWAEAAVGQGAVIQFALPRAGA